MKHIAAKASLAIALLASGCSIMLPAHSRSNKRDGEQVTVRMLSWNQMQEYKDIYNKAFCPDESDKPSCHKLPTANPEAAEREEHREEFAPLVAAAASAAVGFAVDYTAKRLQEEAELYETTFAASTLAERFWIVKPIDLSVERTTTKEWQQFKRPSADKDWKQQYPDLKLIEKETTNVQALDVGKATYAQRYYGIRVARHLRGCSDSDGGEGCDAFEVIYGIAPIDSNQLFQIAPISARTTYARAKVLSDQWFSWLPGPIFGKLIRVPGHYVQTKYSLSIDAIWRDQAGAVKVTNVSPGVETELGQFDLDETKQSIKLQPGNNSLPLAGVPISYDPQGKPVGTGVILVKARFTEKDPSNAKELLEMGANKLSASKEDIQKEVQVLVSGAGK